MRTMMKSLLDRFTWWTSWTPGRGASREWPPETIGDYQWILLQPGRSLLRWPTIVFKPRFEDVPNDKFLYEIIMFIIKVGFLVWPLCHIVSPTPSICCSILLRVWYNSERTTEFAINFWANKMPCSIFFQNGSNFHDPQFCFQKLNTGTKR